MEIPVRVAGPRTENRTRKLANTKQRNVRLTHLDRTSANWSTIYCGFPNKLHY